MVAFVIKIGAFLLIAGIVLTLVAAPETAATIAGDAAGIGARILSASQGGLYDLSATLAN